MAGDRKDLVVFWTRRDSRCDDCREELGSGSLILLRDEKAHCLDCADLGHLEFLPRGDTALTRRAGRYSTLRAVVVQWSRTRKRYERQGTLVEKAALERAEHECLSDADRRAAQRERAARYRERAEDAYVERFARAVRDLYPSCPEGTEFEIAEHACRKYSGRVGRSAAAKSLSPDAIELAVLAHVRHRFTRYDELLMRGWDRDDARTEVTDGLAEVLARWHRHRSRITTSGASAPPE
ncbi:MAG: DUF2293 domain-containing protein [Actinomycetota bacterium]